MEFAAVDESSIPPSGCYLVLVYIYESANVNIVLKEEGNRADEKSYRNNSNNPSRHKKFNSQFIRW